MPSSCSIVRGHVVVKYSTPVVGMSDVRVVLGSLVGTRYTQLGEVYSNKDGAFSFDLDRLPDVEAGASFLEIRVYSTEDRLTAHGDTRWRTSVDPGPLVICVEDPEPCAVVPETFPENFPGANNVYGRVCHLDGTPVASVDVDIREVTATSEPTLNTVTTSPEGWYQATITAPKNIVVRVLEPGTPPTLIGSSRALFGQVFPLRVDVDVCDDKYRQATEWSRIDAALTPLLGATPPEAVSTRQIAVFSGMTGWDVERITLWTLAHRIGLSIPADVESIYGMMRMGFPRSEEGILARPASTVAPALIRAAFLNVIAQQKSVSPDLDTLLAALSQGLEAALGGTRADTLGEILRASGVLTSTQIDEFIELYASHTGTEDEFWAAVYTDPTTHLPSFTLEDHKDEAMRLVTLGTLALSHAPTVASILTDIGTGPASAVAGITPSGWATIVTSARIPVLPSGLPGANDNAQRDSLAGYLAEHAERIFPAATARAGLISSYGTGHDIGKFLDDYPDFDLATSRVDDPAFSAATDDQKTAMKKVQRLYRVAPALNRAEVLRTLELDGFTSAWSIAKTTRARFVAEYGGTLGAETAEEVARKACAMQAITTMALVQAHPSNSQATYQFLPNDDFDTGDFPEWETLFGNTDGCECPHCRSIHGPAAYLVDLLQWLEARQASDHTMTGDSLYTKLWLRRPDIEGIGLSCENAERALPYIDLVLEALESAVENTTAPGEVGPDAAHDTEVYTPDMLAAPQYRNDDAYTTLSTATKAVGLPFARPLVEARAFLAHLGIPRVELMRAYEDSGTFTATDIATEQLGLFDGSLATITTVSPGHETDYWPVSPLGKLEQVVTLRKAGEITWPEILDLLHTRFVNPRTWDSPTSSWIRTLEVVATDWADIDTYTVQLVAGGAPAEADWTRLRQYLRLWKAFGGTVLELDKILQALSITDLSVTTWVEEFGNLRRLAELTDIEPLELAMIRASQIDTFEDRDSREEPVPSLYDSSFLSPAVLVDGDPQYDKFVLNAERNELDYAWAPPSPPVFVPIKDDADPANDYTQAIASALGLTLDELDVLIEQLPGGDLADLSLANLTSLYAWSVLCRATGIGPEDLHALIGLTGLQPFFGLGDVVELVEIAHDLETASWSIDELRYVLLHERTDRVAPTSDFVQLSLGKMRDALRAAYESLGDGSTEASVREEAVRVLAEQLGVNKDALDGLRGLAWNELYGLPDRPAAPPVGASFTLAEDATLTLAAAQSVTVPLGTRCVIPDGAGIKRDGTPETLAVATEALLVADASGQTNTLLASQGANWTVDASGEPLFADSETYAIQSPELPAATTLVTDAGETIELMDPATTVELVDTVSHTPGSALVGPLTYTSNVPASDLLQLFLRQAFLAEGTTSDSPYDDITETAFPDDFTVFRALHKAAMMLQHLYLDEDERAFWYDSANAAAWSVAAVDALGADATAAFGFGPLKALIDLFALRGRIPGSSPSFVELLDAAATGVTEFAAALSERTDWTDADIDVFATQVDPSNPGLATVEGLEVVLDRMDIVRRTGSDANSVTAWAVAPGSVDADSSAQVVAAARSRYEDASAWSSIARPVRDVLRKAQRDALVSHLLTTVSNPEIETADDLYQHYLIDVSMNPEMLTSRIVQACATVQLFVHRLLLGLEIDGSSNPVFEPNAEDREQWEWMRNYRVWEAARKVFLYPENWIEPELRDDKTPFFVKLERELAQGDVTDERVEQALLDYLDRLREVSNLQVLAYHQQKETLSGSGGDDIDILHVFARNRGEPASYWYRRLEDGETWTAWEEVDCGVEGDHLVPVIWGRQLLLFWVEFAQAPLVSSSDTSYWQMRVAWSEHRDGKWSPKRVSLDGKLDAHSGSVESHGLEHYMLCSAIKDDNRIWLPVISRGDDAAGFPTGDYRAHFYLDPCTLELTNPDGFKDTGEDYEGRQAAVGSWLNPGFEPQSSLILYRAETDDEGVPTVDRSAYEEASILGSVKDMTLVVPAQYADFVSQAPFFLQTGTRCWFVRPQEPATDEAAVGAIGSLREGTRVIPDSPTQPSSGEDLARWSLYLPKSKYAAVDVASTALTSADDAVVAAFHPSTLALGSDGYQFSVFYHPHVCAFTEAVRRGGVFALLDPDPDGPEANLDTGSLRRQQLVGLFDFETELEPDPINVATPYPVEDIDFSETGAYSLYNWELFFHVPLYVACRLMDEGRHDESMRFLHAIFDPRVADTDLPSGSVTSARWWKIAPFLEPVSTPVTDWIGFTGANGDTDAAEAFARQVEAWRDDPFNPHLVARLRPGTYQKVTVMRYVENLIAWGDKLFTRDTLETLNEATQLYVYALQILGDRPETLQPRNAPEVKTYAELSAAGDFDAFGNIVLENEYTAEVAPTGTGSASTSVMAGVGQLTYFCIPNNDMLLSMWDTVEDRLFKIRNGMNIEGVVRSLPLFEPPIDPAMLVRASAAGIDIGTALDDLSVALPHHRFPVLHGRATSLAGSVRGLGQALLSALEKKDAEAMALLRQDHELALLEAVEEVRNLQIDEARRSLEAARRSRKVVETRRDYYAKLIEKGWIGKEIAAAALTGFATRLEMRAGAARLVQSLVGAVPDTYAGTLSAVESGGQNFARVAGAVASGFEIGSSASRGAAAYLSTAAAYKRRATEWKHQRKMANKELEQLDKQIAAAEIRLEIAQREKRNHELQVQHSEQVQEFYGRKFTNEELYQWMCGELSALYFQQYQLALATAKKAQACYNHELARSDTFVQAVYWDSLRKGLLAGDRLAATLERMDVSYLEKHQREIELSKTVSLTRLDPMALERLRAEGECYFELPEVLFDLDCPGHYRRRIRSVAVTISCVSGGNGQINSRLTLHGTKLRSTADSSDHALEVQSCSYPSIVTSVAIEDTGVFPESANDGRYMPFEGLGAISSWHLAFSNQEYAQIDWETVTDIKLQLRYTALDGGDAFRTEVLGAIPTNQAALTGGFVDLGITGSSSGFAVAMSAERDDPDAWFHARETPASSSITLTLGTERLPYFAVGTFAGVEKVHVLLCGDAVSETSTPEPKGGEVELDTSGTATVVDLGKFAYWPSTVTDVVHAVAELSTAASWPDTLEVTLNDPAITLDTIDDLVVVLEFAVS